MKCICSLLVLLGVLWGDIQSAEPQTLLEETSTTELSKDRFWGLGTCFAS